MMLFFIFHFFLDANKSAKLLVKVLRNAASAEPNQKLQCSLFLHAQKCESLELGREIFLECENFCDIQVKDARALLISPLRVRMKYSYWGTFIFEASLINNFFIL